MKAFLCLCLLFLIILVRRVATTVDPGQDAHGDPAQAPPPLHSALSAQDAGEAHHEARAADSPSAYEWSLSAGGRVCLLIRFVEPASYHAFLAFVGGQSVAALQTGSADPQGVAVTAVKVLDEDVLLMGLPVAGWRVPGVPDPEALQHYQFLCEVETGQDAPQKTCFLFLFARPLADSSSWRVGVLRHARRELLGALYQGLQEHMCDPGNLVSLVGEELSRRAPGCSAVSVAYDRPSASGMLRPKVFLVRLRDSELLASRLELSLLLAAPLCLALTPAGRRVLLSLADRILRTAASVASFVASRTRLALSKTRAFVGHGAAPACHKAVSGAACVARLVLGACSAISGALRLPNLAVLKSRLFPAHADEDFPPLLTQDPTDRVPLAATEDAPLDPHFSLYPRVSL